MGIKKTTIISRCVIALAASVFSVPAFPAQELARIPFFYADPGSAALGAGFRMGNSPYLTEGADAVPLDLVPLYLYNGKYLFARGTSGGVHAIRNDNFQFNVIARYRFQRLDPATLPFYEGLDERKQSLDAGLEMRVLGDWGELTFDWVTDTLNRHNGQELGASYRYIFQMGNWYLSPFVEWAYQNENLANYYFGVSEEEALARPDLGAYRTGSAQVMGFGLNTVWHVNPRLQFYGNIGFYGSGNAIEDSPLVEEPRASGAFIGGVYIFGNTLSPVTNDEQRKSEWSWRANYGYQADGNIISEIDQGDFSKSSLVDTNIAGLTLGRLLSDGKRADFYGKVSWYRHLEDPYQENFSSWSAYIMAMATGYSPWSGNEIFRWGFGFGMSYADKVPAAEQLKQAEKGGNTSHFLNYLELQVDFPLARVSKAKWLQNCYAGVTVVHRSGIFGTSNILGDVAGGADWITASLECMRR